MGGKRMTIETRQQIGAMLQAGTTPKLICQQLNLSSSSVSRIKKEIYPDDFAQPDGTGLSRGQRAAATRSTNKVKAEQVAASKVYRTVKFGKDEFVVPAAKGVRFTINEANEISGFEVL
jgi:IS30 family transposase